MKLTKLDNHKKYDRNYCTPKKKNKSWHINLKTSKQTMHRLGQAAKDAQEHSKLSSFFFWQIKSQNRTKEEKNGQI